MTSSDSSTTVRRSLWRRTGVILARFVWILAGVWTALAVFYTAPLPTWLRIASAIAIMGCFVMALRRPRRTDGASAGLWPPSRGWAIAAAAVAVPHAAYYLFAVSPDPDQDWAEDHARIPAVRIDGNLVRIQDVRNFDWRARTDFTPAFFDAVYDVNLLDSVDYVIAPFSEESTIAHVFLCFGFSDGQRVAVSIEGRRLRGQSYSPIGSLFRQHQLIYVVGTERDVLGLRGAIWKKRVQLYPIRTTPERKRSLFLSMMRRADSLEERPEFYNLVTNNCMNNIVRHLCRLGGRQVPSEFRVLLTGLSDRVAYNLGYFDTDLPFAQAREFFRADGRIRTYFNDPAFSQRIRRLPVETP